MQTAKKLFGDQAATVLNYIRKYEPPVVATIYD